MSGKSWTEEQEKELVRLYVEEEIKDVYVIADLFNKGYRSVISKLVQLKVYEKPYVEQEEKTLTVKEMLREIEQMLEIEIDGINLNKKENLRKLVAALQEKHSDRLENS